MKNDNILVKEDGNLVLVDYDGMFVPAMRGQRSPELGSVNFRHPNRTAEDFDEHIDDFPLSMMALALRAAALNPFLITDFGTKESLLFQEKDFINIANSALSQEFLQLLYDKPMVRLYALFHLTLGEITLSVNQAEYIIIQRGEIRDKYDLMCDEARDIVNNKDTSSEDFERAFNTLLVLAKHHHLKAIKTLGNCYYHGIGVEKDLAEAVKWYTKAAEQGYAYAQNNLGLCYIKGDGVEKDLAEAVKWYTKAAEQGLAYAQCNLGGCYYYGNGVEEDLAKAVEWYTKAAEQGNAEAQCNLGLCYRHGNGIEKDLAKAVKWYTMAAKQGNAAAQNFLGLCYSYGDGVEEDLSEAVNWFTMAAEQGHADAQHNLSRYLQLEED